ncbi:MAG: hypothetical protein ISR48_01615 [Alphaproteobacteria bacterium]|nr:hypothetical protein [Alphaproteobacteria bacterium]
MGGGGGIFFKDLIMANIFVESEPSAAPQGFHVIMSMATQRELMKASVPQKRMETSYAMDLSDGFNLLVKMNGKAWLRQLKEELQPRHADKSSVEYQELAYLFSSGISMPTEMMFLPGPDTGSPEQEPEIIATRKQKPVPKKGKQTRKKTSGKASEKGKKIKKKVGTKSAGKGKRTKQKEGTKSADKGKTTTKKAKPQKVRKAKPKSRPTKKKGSK